MKLMNGANRGRTIAIDESEDAVKITHIKSSPGTVPGDRITAQIETESGIVGMVLASHLRGGYGEIRRDSGPLAKVAVPAAEGGTASVFFPEPLAPGEVLEAELSGQFIDLFVYTKET